MTSLANIMQLYDYDVKANGATRHIIYVVHITRFHDFPSLLSERVSNTLIRNNSSTNNTKTPSVHINIISYAEYLLAITAVRFA